MASILILGVKVPFTRGGQEVLVESLLKELRARGHTADIVDLPYSPWPKEGLLKQIAIWRSLDLHAFAGRNVDLVIATKFPSYFAQHPKKSLWLVHQHRAIYDLYGSRYSDFSDDPRDEELRSLLVEADTKALGECSYRSAISQNVAGRLKTFNKLNADFLYPPLSNSSFYYSGRSDPYILSVGRICTIKRVDLILKSLPMIHSFVKLKIVGTPDEPGVMDYLNNEIDKHHLWDRVEFLGRVGDEEIFDLYANSLAVYYAPHNEDYGYVTLEAFASGKPVISAVDSGGVLEFLRHEENGLIAEPTFDGISKAANRLIEDEDLRTRLGFGAKQTFSALPLDEKAWDGIVKSLLSPLD